MVVALPLQVTFLKMVELREEKKEKVELKCWAGFATEDKMREVLKLTPPPKLSIN